MAKEFNKQKISMLLRYSMNSASSRRGFTLVELAIVIVIIGLVVAGVTAGQSLVKSTRVNAQISQLQQYNAAFSSFRMQYGYSPGDLPNATSYWPSAASLINGNGNEFINDSSGPTKASVDDDGVSATRVDMEKLQFFRHLSLSGLIQEQYDGSQVLGKGYPKLAYDSQYGFFAGSYWRINGSVFHMAAPGVPKASVFAPRVYLSLTVGNPNGMIIGQPWTMAWTSIFVPRDLSNIDIKLDDGVWNSGKLFGFSACCSTSSYNCTTDGVNYNISSSLRECVAMYRLR